VPHISILRCKRKKATAIQPPHNPALILTIEQPTHTAKTLTKEKDMPSTSDQSAPATLSLPPDDLTRSLILATADDQTGPTSA
jgi:hypothetical protein